VTAVDIDGPRLARSVEEAYLYLDLHPCPCGGDDARRDSAVRVVDEQWTTRYTCVCAACGAARAVDFREPGTPVRPPAGGWAADPTPSELVDAGQWLWVSDTFGSVPADPDGLTAEQVGQARQDLALAAAALDEVLKFVPDGLDEVPGAGFWTEQGEQLWGAQRHRFTRQSLEHTRDSYRALAARFPAPEPR
jgi:hypothetical protein